MDAAELEQFIREQAKKIEALAHNKPGSAEYRFESEILKDAKQLLAEKIKAQHPSEPSF